MLKMNHYEGKLQRYSESIDLLQGGKRLGTFLDSITKEAGNLDLHKAFSTFGLTYKPSDEPKRKEGTETVVWEGFSQAGLVYTYAHRATN